MKDYDLELNDDSIIDSIEKDSLKRNVKVNKMLELLNNINSNKIISIDGKWGCGKTVFLRQIEIINKKHVEKLPNMDINNIKKFKEKYIVYYYNAWENDCHSSPLLSLIYNLINDFSSEQNQIASSKKLPFNLKEALKTISMNFFDIDRVENFKDVASEIYTTEEKKQSLNKLIEHIVPRNKRLVFIVDELDRCKPSYAVELLEVIKHFYSNNRIVFLLGTNNEQLSCTVSNYYGLNFDGYGYLNKFYNMIISLDDIASTEYLNLVIGIEDSSLWINSSIHAVCNYFKFQMRDINRIVSDFEILNEYLTTNRGDFYGEDTILKYIFLPFCLGLKIKNKHFLNNFFSGDYYEELEKYVKLNNQIYLIAAYDYKHTYKIENNSNIIEDNILKHLKEKYETYFKNDIDDWGIKESKKVFINIFSLLSNFIKFE